MNLETEREIITLTDDDGEEYELLHLNTLEYEGTIYMAFTPVENESEDEETLEIVILKRIEDDEGETLLSTLDSDEEAERIYELFVVRLEQENDDDFDDDEDFEDDEDFADSDAHDESGGEDFSEPE